MPAVPITHIGQCGQGAQEADGAESQHKQLTMLAQHSGILVHQGSDDGFQAPKLQIPPRRTQSEAEAMPWGLCWGGLDTQGCSVHFRTVLPFEKVVDIEEETADCLETNWEVQTVFSAISALEIFPHGASF